MSAIVNSQNVTFAVVGGNFPVSASFIVGGIDNSTGSKTFCRSIRLIKDS